MGFEPDVGPPRYCRSMSAVRVLDPAEISSRSPLVPVIDDVRNRLPPGWRVVVLDVDGDLVVAGGPDGALHDGPPEPGL